MLAELILPKIVLDQKILSNINEALSKEWLITNGLGGYASSTVLGVNTRKYHGLLVAAINPPINRWVLLTKIDETLKIKNKNFALGANNFQDIIYPEGYRFLSRFIVDPFPTYTYNVQNVILQKTIFMPYMKNVTVIIYKVSNPLNEKISMKDSPIVNSRHIYDTTQKDT